MPFVEHTSLVYIIHTIQKSKILECTPKKQIKAIFYKSSDTMGGLIAINLWMEVIP